VSVLKLLGGSVLALLALQLSIAFFLPIYTDEIGFKWDYARAFLDDGRTQLLTISCRADPTSAWPWLWIPARALDALLYQDLSDLSKLRVLGLAYAGVFFVSLYLLVRRAGTAFAGAPGWLVFAFGASFCALGVLPFLLVMNRPELELMAALALMLVVTLRDAHRPPEWVLAVAVAVLQYYLFSRHPKALLLVPLFLACWLALPVGRAARVLGALWTAILAGSLFLFYSAHLQCPLDGYVRALTAANVLAPAMLLEDPRYFLWRGFENLLGSLQYVGNTAFRVEYQSDWLPADASRDRGLGRLASLGIEIAWLAPLAVSILGVLRLATKRLFQRAAPERTAAASAVFVGLLASVALTCFFQIQRNDYRSTQILLSLLLCALLALVAVFEPLKPRTWRTAMALVFAVAIAPPVMAQSARAEAPVDLWSRPGPTIGQRFSVGHIGYARFRSELVELGRECGISEDHPPAHLALDDATYPAFWRSRLPYHLVYLTGGWANGIGDLKSFLEQRRYGGVVSVCDRLPRSLRQAAKTRNGLCCLPARR